MAGAVSVTLDRERTTQSRQRLSSKVLPENLFNPFRNCRSKRRQLVTPRENQTASGVPAAEVPAENPHITSAAAAAIAVQGIKKGVSDALNRWALQTARRESMVLWRHECSRYASSSRIGYHPNHPSSSRPSSRPSSAATILRPFSAGRVTQRLQQHQQRSSSARPSRFRPQEVEEACPARAAAENAGRGSETAHTRPRSAIPRLGVDMEEDADHADGRRTDLRSRRGVSASAALDGSSDDGAKKDPPIAGRRRGGSGDNSRHGNNTTRGTRSASGRSQSPVMSNHNDISYKGDEDEAFDDIYEDLDEGDDELDNRISIMENRFSTVGRERPDSAVGDGIADLQHHQRQHGPRQAAANSIPRSAITQRPPRAPSQEHRQVSTGPRPLPQHFISSEVQGLTRGGLRDGATGGVGRQPPLPSSTGFYGAQAPLVIRSRPTSAPVDGGSYIYQYQQERSGDAVHDPMAPLHARRLRLQMSSAGGAEELRSQVGRPRTWRARDEVDQHQHQHQQRVHPVRDVTTALPSWNREGDGGSRPLSSATEGGSPATGVNSNSEGNNTDANFELKDSTPFTTPSSSRPSSAAFRSWIKARPSALSAVSAVSSARTLGMDDPELVHLQLEMESRRGGMSEATLARV
ncbi:unnamed protein product [Hapterophycus canaliculatus]